MNVCGLLIIMLAQTSGALANRLPDQVSSCFNPYFYNDTVYVHVAQETARENVSDMILLPYYNVHVSKYHVLVVAIPAFSLMTAQIIASILAIGFCNFFIVDKLNTIAETELVPGRLSPSISVVNGEPYTAFLNSYFENFWLLSFCLCTTTCWALLAPEKTWGFFLYAAFVSWLPARLAFYSSLKMLISREYERIINRRNVEDIYRREHQR